MSDKQGDKTLFTDAVKELVAIGAAIGSNCEMCFKHHYNEARKRRGSGLRARPTERIPEYAR